MVASCPPIWERWCWPCSAWAAPVPAECPERRALSGHVWINAGLGVATCQPPAYLRAGGALLGLEASFVPSEWVAIDNQVSGRTVLGL